MRASRILVIGLFLALGMPPGASAQTRDVEVGPAPRLRGQNLKTNSWAVVVGIDRYQNPRIPTLNYPVNDARRVQENLARLGFPEANTFVLLNEQATRSRIVRLFTRTLPARVKRDERLFVFFASHAVTKALAGGAKEGYLLPHDADPEDLHSTAISLKGIERLARRVPAKHQLYVINACLSSGVMRAAPPVGITEALRVEPRFTAAPSRAQALQVITAGTEGERVLAEGGNGVFTRQLLDGLNGPADLDRNRALTATELVAWLYPNVLAASDGRQHVQFARLGNESGEFVFVLPDPTADQPPTSVPSNVGEEPAGAPPTIDVRGVQVDTTNPCLEDLAGCALLLGDGQPATTTGTQTDTDGDGIPDIDDPDDDNDGFRDGLDPFPLDAAKNVTDLSGADLVTFWGGLSASDKSELVGLLGDSQLETVLAGFPASDVASFWSVLSATQQAALLDDLTLAQAVALASLLSEAQLVTVLARFSGADLITLWDALSATQQAALFDDLTAAQFTTLISAAEDGNLTLADVEGTASVTGEPGLSTQADLEATLQNQGGNVAGQGLGPGYTTNALDPTNTAGSEANPTGAAQPYQALYSQDSINQIQSSGLLAYAVQVEEDVVNRAALERVQALGTSDVRASLWDSINTALDNGGIRERDALLEAEADARAGRVLVDASGNRVRVQQYVLRPNDKTVQVTAISLRGSSAGDLAGLSYIDWQTRFKGSIANLSAQALRDLPWSDWLTTSSTPSVGRYVPTQPGGSTPQLKQMSVEFANGVGDLLREERSFGNRTRTGGPGGFWHQKLQNEKLTLQGGTPLAFTTSSSPSGGEYTVVPGDPDGVNPRGFKYRYNDGTIREIPVAFFVLGDATTTANTGVQAGFDGVEFNDIWDALRVNLGSAPQIGPNNLEISIDRTKSFFSAPIDAVYVPWTRMVWQ